MTEPAPRRRIQDGWPGRPRPDRRRLPPRRAFVPAPPRELERTCLKPKPRPN